jgi:hypothetical protein
MGRVKLEEGFVRKKMLINGVKADVIVPISGLDEVKHLIIE